MFVRFNKTRKNAPERLWASRADRRLTLRTVHAPFARLRAQPAPESELRGKNNEAAADRRGRANPKSRWS